MSELSNEVESFLKEMEASLANSPENPGDTYELCVSLNVRKVEEGGRSTEVQSIVLTQRGSYTTLVSLQTLFLTPLLRMNGWGIAKARNLLHRKK